MDNSLTVRLPRRQVIDPSRIEVGDIIVGFSSTGRANWESVENSGIGSNGLTNARHDTLAPMYRMDDETYAPEIRPRDVYCGRYRLEDGLPGDSLFTIASALLSPTRTYLPLIRELRQDTEPKDLKALIHCSGGGQTKIGKFGPAHVRYVKDEPFPVTPLFKMLQEVGNLPWDQMYSAYNMGWRLEAVVKPEVEVLCVNAARRCGIHAQRVGYVVAAEEGKKRVTIVTPYGTFEY